MALILLPFADGKKGGKGRISLKRSVPYTRSAKPTTCSIASASQPRKSETAHINTVRHVSISERAVALTDFVTANPEKLKKAIQHAIASEVIHIAGDEKV